MLSGCGPEISEIQHDFPVLLMYLKTRSLDGRDFFARAVAVLHVLCRLCCRAGARVNPYLTLQQLSKLAVVFDVKAINAAITTLKQTGVNPELRLVTKLQTRSLFTYSLLAAN